MNKISIKYSNTAVICLSPFHGGMEMDAVRITKLIASSVNVCLIAKKNSPINTNYTQQLTDKNIELKTVDFRSVYSPSIILSVRKIIKERNIKNVIYLGASELHALALSFMGLDINLVIRHGTTKTRPKKDFLHRLTYKNVNYHIAICKHLANNIKYIFPFGKNTELKTIYSSLRDQPSLTTTPNLLEDKPVRLIHVGRILDSKGQVDAINACDILFQKNILFDLTFLGDFESGYESTFNACLDSKPYKNQVHILGFKSNLAKYYKNSDILLFPSKGEGLSNTFIEALSYGLVCISYNNTSFPEIRDLGFKFFIAENLNLKSLQTNLLEAVEYLKSEKTPVTDNINLALALFSPQRELEEYLNLLE